MDVDTRTVVRRISPDERIAAVAQVLLDLARLPVQDLPCAEAICSEVTEAVSRSVDVDRVGIWVMEGTGLRLVDGYQRSLDAHHAGTQIGRAGAEPYFAALANERFIIANDARQHPATACFTASYLEPLGITAMLDAPVLRDGRVWGVLCIEHVGSHPRTWTAAEQTLAAALADCTASLLERHDRLRAERALSAQRSELERAGRLANVERLVGGIAHDFRNLMTVISGGAELIDRKRGDRDALERNLKRMREALQAGIGLCERLDVFARSSLGMREVIAVAPFLGERAAELRALTQGTRRFTLDAEVEVHVEIEAELLRRVLVNLMVNAVEATSPGGEITITLRQETAYAEHQRLRPGGYAVIAVSDDGCGIGKEVMARIGEPFLTTKPEQARGGLGLPTVLQIVASAKGEVVFSSKAGVGTRVEVWLPLATAP